MQCDIFKFFYRREIIKDNYYGKRCIEKSELKYLIRAGRCLDFSGPSQRHLAQINLSPVLRLQASFQ